MFLNKIKEYQGLDKTKKEMIYTDTLTVEVAITFCRLEGIRIR